MAELRVRCGRSVRRFVGRRRERRAARRAAADGGGSQLHVVAPAPLTIRAADTTVHGLTDAVGSFATFAAAFPDADDSLATCGRRAYPELWRDDAWELPFRAFLLQPAGGRNVLIDTGIGPRPGTFLPDRQGWLLDQLRDVGVEPAAVDAVVFTHLHVDHIGWASVGGTATFANARYLVPERDWQFFGEATPALIEEKFGGIPRERLELYSGPRDEDAFELVPTPGHTPGHASVVVHSGSERLFVLGDVAVHPLQIDEPALVYESDVEAETAARTRAAVVADLRDSNTVVAAGHFPRAFGRIAGDGGPAWQSVRSSGRA